MPEYIYQSTHGMVHRMDANIFYYSCKRKVGLVGGDVCFSVYQNRLPGMGVFLC